MRITNLKESQLRCGPLCKGKITEMARAEVGYREAFLLKKLVNFNSAADN